MRLAQAASGIASRSDGPAVELFLPAAGGTEAWLAEEVRQLTGEPAQAGRGGVWARGSARTAMRLNLESRLAQRVLWPLASGPYRDEHDLYDLARRQVDWPAWISPAMTLSATAISAADSWSVGSSFSTSRPRAISLE